MRFVQIGYWTDQVSSYLGKLPEQRQNSTIRSYSDERKEHVMAVSLGCHLDGAVLPYPDIRDPSSGIEGARKRLVPIVNEPDKKLLRQFRQFCRKWNHDNLVPLPVDTDLSVGHWLDSTTYNVARKTELSAIASSGVDVGKQHYKCKSFIKAENYTDYKFPRCINSRTDVFKVFTGPTFKAIESVVYQNPYFIKHVPVSERANYISQFATPGYEYVATDHSSFEARISSDIMHACELQLYSYMTQNLPNHKDFMGHVIAALAGRNVCQFKRFTVTVRGNRMSGDMCTSLGNGYTNLMSMLFLSSLKGLKPRGVVEGDDGLFAFPYGKHPNIADYKSLGFDIKLKTSSAIGDAGFCGMYFGPDKTNVVDIGKVITSFGWTDSQCKCGGDKVLRGLLKAKALSLLYEVPYCPVANSLARYALRMTKWSKPIWEKTLHNVYSWKQQRALFSSTSVLPSVIPLSNYDTVERLFGYSVASQRRLEHYFDNCNVLQPIPRWVCYEFAQPAWIDAFNFCKRMPRRLIN